MKLGQWFSKLFLGTIADDTAWTIDFAPVSGSADYDAKLKDAAKKYGRAFKCAAETMPREVFLSGKEKIETDAPLKQKATVTKIHKERKA